MGGGKGDTEEGTGIPERDVYRGSERKKSRMSKHGLGSVKRKEPPF